MQLETKITNAITSQFCYQDIDIQRSSPISGITNLTITYQGTKTEPHQVNFDDYDDLKYIIGDVLFDMFGTDYSWGINHFEGYDTDGIITDCKTEILVVNVTYRSNP